MIFSDSPSQKALERMMTQVKGFPPRGSGVMVLRRFEYTAEMCDCRLCLYYNRKKKCTVSQCPCIEERIVAGAAGRSEVMTETMKDIHNAAFRKRLIQFIRESEELHMNFRNEKHRLAFDEAIRKLNKKNFALMSALYLLTAEHKLWVQIRNFVERNEIKFDRFKPKDSTENGYTLLCCAKDLYLGTKHITISDLADTELIAPKMFALICNAMAIRRFGLGAIQYKERTAQKGDAILNKTYIRDCLSKKVMINNGERPKYYVENNHPAIIDSGTFGRVQEEMARRGGKRKVKQVGTKTEQGRYSSKYALTELLICGECGTPYRRCTWAANGKKKIVWRCINRLDYGKKYCHNSPSIEESVLQEAIMKAVMQTAKQNAEVLKTLKLHIGMSLSAETTEDNSLDLQIRIAEIEAEFQKMLKAIAADNVEAFDEEKAKALMDEKAKLQIQLDRIADTKQKRENAKSRLDEIFTIIEALANHPISYDDQIVRQILESVIVESKEKIKVVFVGGLEVTLLM